MSAPTNRRLGKSTAHASHSESSHTDPAGRIASARPLKQSRKTRLVVHDPG